jgi:hypothetical protein
MYVAKTAFKSIEYYSLISIVCIILEDCFMMHIAPSAWDTSQEHDVSICWFWC